MLPLLPGQAGLWLYELNETSAFLWNLLEREQEVDALTRALSDEFGVASDEVRGDVESFLTELKNAGAIQ